MGVMLLLGGGLSFGGAAEADAVIRDLVAAREALEDIPFAEVVQAATGKRIVPLDPKRDAILVERIGMALERAVATLRATSHPAHREKRINEVSRHLEEAIRTELDRVDGFACDFPHNREGRLQRSGYPDLRLVVEADGRVLYLDPKLFAAASRNSSLRTFYFTPQRETAKINEDAHHLLIGVPHRGRQGGVWQFGGWEIVDLAKFRVRLKVEFQAGNRDVYQDENIVARATSGDDP